MDKQLKLFDKDFIVLLNVSPWKPVPCENKSRCAAGGALKSSCTAMDTPFNDLIFLNFAILDENIFQNSKALIFSSNWHIAHLSQHQRVIAQYPNDMASNGGVDAGVGTCSW